MNKNMSADGNVGLPILGRFRLLIDLTQSRVWFALPFDASVPFDVNHSGLTLAPDRAGAKVLYVAPGSPADTAGLKADDVIVTIDGMIIKDWEAKAGLTNWIYGKPGRQVHTALQDGAVRSLTFSKYF